MALRPAVTLRARSLAFGPGEWWALGAAVGFGVGNVLTRQAAGQGDPLAGTLIRLLPLAALTGLVTVLRWRQAARLWPGHAQFFGWRTLGLLALYSLIVTPLTHLTLFLSLRYGSVVLAVPLFSTFPLFGALMAVPFLRQRLNRRMVAGLVVCVLGITLLTYGQQAGQAALTPQWPLAALFALLGGVCLGLSGNFSGYLLRRGLDVWVLLGVTSAGAVLAFVAWLAAAGNLGALAAFPAEGLRLLGAAGAFNAVGMFALFTAFGLATVASVGAIKSLDVGVAAVIAVAALGEVLSGLSAVGIVLIMAGVLVVQLAQAAPPRQAARA